MKKPQLPPAPSSIQAGASLADLLSLEVISVLADNLILGGAKINKKNFLRDASRGLKELAILQRGQHVAQVMRTHLPPDFSEAIEIILNSLTPPNEATEDLGLAVFFYLPHVSFVANFGLEHFDVSMKAQYELTRRFSSEFSIRPFLKQHPAKTLAVLKKWTKDADPHVRRLCSEGTRPRLPWAMRLPEFVKDPSPVLPILEALKDDPSLYVRRSVANHLGDIAKDHPTLVFKLCEAWLKGASSERKWVIRHALRYPAKKGSKKALTLRTRAK